MLSKKFEDSSDFLLACKVLYPSAFVYPQPGFANDVDESASSGHAAKNDDASSINQDTLERLVEMAGVLPMKEADEDDLDATNTEKVFDQGVGMRNDALSICDNESMSFPIQKFKNVLEGLVKYSVDLRKGYKLASEGIDLLDLKKGTMGQHQVAGILIF